MSNLAKIIIEEYPKNDSIYGIVSKLSATRARAMNSDVSGLPPPCFEEFCELFNCLNKTGDYSKCGEKYKSFTECFNKFYK